MSAIVLSTWRLTLGALASQILPADPGVVTDVAAGALTYTWAGATTSESFADAVIRFVSTYSGFPQFTPSVEVTAVVLAELDAQANAVVPGAAFWQLSDPQQQTIMAAVYGTAAFAYFDPTIVPITQPQLNAYQFQALARQLTTGINTVYWGINWSMHTMSENLIGVGAVPAGTARSVRVYSDPPNQIMQPNVVAAPISAAWTYRRWAFPVRYGVEVLYQNGMVEAQAQPVAADAALASLIGFAQAQTLWVQP